MTPTTEPADPLDDAALAAELAELTDAECMTPDQLARFAELLAEQERRQLAALVVDVDDRAGCP